MVMKTLIIIPAYNEELSIASVIKEVQGLKAGYDIVVVNDGSSDRTREEAKRAGARVLQLPINLGIGGAMQTGFRYAVRTDYDCAVQVDGDGQHPANEIPRLVSVIAAGGADVAIGSRFLEKKGFQSTFSRRLGIRYFQFLHQVLARVRVTDSTSGFRALGRRALAIVDGCYPDEFPESESIVLFALRGLKIREVPVVMRGRRGGESSIRRLISLYYMFKVTLAIIFTYLRLRKGRI
jgi:glycosyltransferase involved in cell wall biosynthesis